MHSHIPDMFTLTPHTHSGTIELEPTSSGLEASGVDPDGLNFTWQSAFQDSCLTLAASLPLIISSIWP
jgi:hypothetical protein